MTVFALWAAGAMAPASVLADDEGGHRGGAVHIIKNCQKAGGKPGDYCTIVSSNVPEIPPNSTVNYDQGAYMPASGAFPNGVLDSNVLLDTGGGNVAIGRCTLDVSSQKGVCTFTDGTGTLAHFYARVNVAATTLPDYSWTGRYEFGEAGE